MDTSILNDLGFSNAEVKVYIALLEFGSTTVGPLIEKTELQNSVIHLTLHKLCKKGFVTFYTKSRFRHYQASAPEKIVRYIDKKKQSLEELIPQLVSRQKTHEKQDVEVFEGFEGLKFMNHVVAGNAKKGDEHLYFSFFTKNADDFDEVFTFFEEYERAYQRYGIVIKGIIPSSIKYKFKKRDPKNLLFVNFPVPTNIAILNNYVTMTPWEDGKTSFLITSRHLADSFRSYFYSIWDRYKK